MGLTGSESLKVSFKGDIDIDIDIDIEVDEDIDRYVGFFKRDLNSVQVLLSCKEAVMVLT